MHKDIQKMIDIVRQNGALTNRQREIILNKAKALGEDLDEVEIILESICPAGGESSREINPKIQEPVSSREIAASDVATKDDKISRCPNCGAILPGRVSQCPECGFVFNNVSSSASLNKLSEELKKATSKNKRKRLIESYVTPNTKSELLDFIIFVKPHILDKADENRASFQKKYSESIDKCKKYFPNNSDVKTYIDEYETLKGDIRKDQRSRKLKSLTWMLPVFILLIFAFYEGFIFFRDFNKDKQYLRLENLSKYLEDKDYQSVRLSLNALLSNDNLSDYSQVAGVIISHTRDAVSADELEVADTLLSILYSLPEDSFDEASIRDVLFDLSDKHYKRFEDDAAEKTLKYFPVNDPNMLAFYLKKSVEYALMLGYKGFARGFANDVFLYLSDQPQSTQDEVFNSLSKMIDNAEVFPSFGYYLQNPYQVTTVYAIVPGSEAEKQGLSIGDRIVSRDLPSSWADYYEAAREKRETTHKIIHDGVEITYKLPMDFYPYEF